MNGQESERFKASQERMFKFYEEKVKDKREMRASKHQEVQVEAVAQRGLRLSKKRLRKRKKMIRRRRMVQRVRYQKLKTCAKK